MISTQEAITDILTPHLSPGGPGLVVGVAQHDKVLFESAFGLAHIELGVPMSVDIVLPIASISKHMAALCALLVAKDGLIDLGAQVGTYLPELAGAQALPTLRELMTHQSGLHCHLDIGPLVAEMPAIRRDGFCLDLLRQVTSANAPPGAWQVYGNTGFNLLSLVIERACAMPFERVMAERVFQPMGLASARLFRGANRLRQGVASLYVRASELGDQDDGGWVNTSDIRTENLGEGGVHCTVGDLLRWAGMLRREAGPIPQSLWREMKTPAILADGSPSEYGLGLIFRDTENGAFLGHGGGLIGLSSFVMTIPDHALDVVIIANSMLPVEDVAHRIAAAVLGSEAWGTTPRPAAMADFPELEGAFFESANVLIGFDEIDGKVGLRLQGYPVMQVGQDLADAESLVLQTAIGPLRLTFPDGPGAESALMTWGGVTEHCRRLAPLDPAAAFTDIAGTYLREDVGSTICIRLAEGVLTATRPGRPGTPPVTLSPLAPDAFRFNSTGLSGAYLCRLIRDQTGAIAGLRFDTTRTRNFTYRRLPDPAC